MWRILFICFLISNLSIAYEKEITDYNPWTPVSNPFGHRLKPVKKEPKPEDDKMFFVNNAYVKPYIPASYIQGLHTFPYYAYSELSPVYQAIYPYPVPESGSYFIRKEKEKVETENYV